MERARHRKSKSASGIEGIQQIQKQKAGSRLSSDYHSYIDESNRDDVFMFNLGQSSLGRPSGIPMKKLLEEEMSKDVESKRRSPSVIARLMGLEGLPSPRQVHRQHKRVSDNYQQKCFLINTQQNSQVHDGRSYKRSLIDQQEFKDVYEDLEASHAANRRCSSRWSSSSILTKPEMQLIQQKFNDAKRLSTDKRLQDSKELDETLEMLDSNKDLLLKYLRQPDSLFAKHLHELQVDEDSTLGSQIAVLKPSKSVNYDSKAKTWRPDRDTLSKHHVTSHLKREDGLLLEPHSRHRAHTPRTLSRIPREKKSEEKILPTRIVVLKPNLEKMRDAGTFSLSPDLSDSFQPSFKKIEEHPSVRGAETASRRRKDSFHNVGSSKPMSKEAREIAREITMRMIDRCDENMDTKSIGLKGYVGDDSSYDANASDSESESEMFNLSSRNSFDDSSFCRHPSPHLGETSVNREAKKRLSERWKMTHKYQDLEMVSKGNTLGEMLALPDREARLNSKKSLVGRASNRPSSSNVNAMSNHDPLGISSRDGWKDAISRNSSRSRSLPPSTGGRSQRSTYNDELAEDKHPMHGSSLRRGRSKVVKGNISHKEDYLSKDMKCRGRGKKPHSCQHTLIDEIDSSSEAKFEIKMEANTKDLYNKQSVFQMAADDKSPVVDVVMISEPGSLSVTPKSTEFLEVQLSSVIDDDNPAAHRQEDTNLQEVQGPDNPGSPSLQCRGAEPDSSESSKEADHPSPVSVLEVPFTEDASSSESFERVSAELHELRMQLRLLKMESGTYAEVSSNLAPIAEEAAQLSPVVSEGSYSGPEDWKSCYALDVLIHSGLEESNVDMFYTKCYSVDCPLDPKLFDNLEKKYSDETTGLRPERKLLFDGVNAALSEIFHNQVNPSDLVMSKLVVFNSNLGGVRDALERLINQDFGNGEISDKELDKEMMWSDCKGEMVVIGNEIEKLLIDDMIIEVLCN